MRLAVEDIKRSIKMPITGLQCLESNLFTVIRNIRNKLHIIRRPTLGMQQRGDSRLSIKIYQVLEQQKVSVLHIFKISYSTNGTHKLYKLTILIFIRTSQLARNRR